MALHAAGLLSMCCSLYCCIILLLYLGRFSQVVVHRLCVMVESWKSSMALHADGVHGKCCSQYHGTFSQVAVLRLCVLQVGRAWIVLLLHIATVLLRLMMCCSAVSV